jgi:hypothetical protein
MDQGILNIRSLGQGPALHFGDVPHSWDSPIVEQEKNIIIVFRTCTPQGVGGDNSYTYSLRMEGSKSRHNFHPTLKE